jgi:hypothetical protein
MAVFLNAAVVPAAVFRAALGAPTNGSVAWIIIIE